MSLTYCDAYPDGYLSALAAGTRINENNHDILKESKHYFPGNKCTFVRFVYFHAVF